MGRKPKQKPQTQPQPSQPKPVKLAIVCAYRNEPDLDATIASAKESAAGCELRVVKVEDTQAVGCGKCRHWGIEAATEWGADAVVIIDAHMRFSDGLLYNMARAVNHNPKLMIAAPCHHNDRCSFDGVPYRAARLTLRADNHLEKVALAAQWCNAEETPNAVMGACYAFAPSLYQAMGQPLGLLHSWGCDEEYLSSACYFAGGRVALFDGGACAHLFRQSGVAVPGPDLNASIWANRLQLLDMLPLQVETFEDLQSFVMRSAVFTVPEFAAAIREKVKSEASNVGAVRRKLASYGMDSRPWLASCRQATICDGRPSTIKQEISAPPPQRQPDPPQIVTRAAERCERCDTVDPFRQTAGMRPMGERSAVGFARCYRCGHKARIIKSY